MKKILLIILAIIILIALAGIYKFNFTNDDIYVVEDSGEVVQIDESHEYTEEEKVMEVMEDDKIYNIEENIGRLEDVFDKNNKSYITIDYIQWLSGKDCILRGIETDSPFCIINENTKLRTFEIDKNTKISITDWPQEEGKDLNKVISIDELKRYTGYGIFNVVIVDGVVEQMIERYIP